MSLVEVANLGPHSVARAAHQGAGVAVCASTNKMPPGVAREGIQRKQADIRQKHQRSKSHPYMGSAGAIGKEECIVGIFPQYHYKHYGCEESVPVKILHDQRKSALAAILFVPHCSQRSGLFYRATEWIGQIRAIQHFAVVIAAESEAQWERQNDKRRGYHEVADVNTKLQSR